MKVTENELKEARKIFTPESFGTSEIKCKFLINVVSVSKSGMSRNLKIKLLKDGELYNYTYLISKLTNNTFTKNNTLRIPGCGMDMCFEILYQLYCTLYDPKTYVNYNFRYMEI